MAEAWAVGGIDLPEGFVFPITKLGQMADVHGEGVFVNPTPTRVDCYVHVEIRPEPGRHPSRLEILPSPLHPDRGTELAVAYEFEQQFFLAPWLYRGFSCRIVARPSRRPIPATLSLRDEALQDFLHFAKALLDFHDDRQAYFVARHTPDVLEEHDVVRMVFVSGHSVDANWLKARWPLMAATDLYDRARRARDADVRFLMLMMSLEVLFSDEKSELSRRLAQRCAFLNGRDSSERKAIFDRLAGRSGLYNRRSRLVHGDLFDRKGFVDVPEEDQLLATSLVRVSLLRFIALSPRTKVQVMDSLDDAIFNSSVADQLHAEVDGYWANRGVDVESLLDAHLGLQGA